MLKEPTSVIRRKLRTACVFVCLAQGVVLLSISGALAQQNVQPRVAAAVAPEWPTHYVDGKTSHEETVLVRIELDGFGNVVSARLLTRKSPPSDSATRAAQLWKFGPPEGSGPESKLNGTTITLKFTFRMLPASATSDELGTVFVPAYEIDLARRIE